MGAKLSTVMTPFGCSRCGVTLGYTAPGEAERMGTRASIFCENCKDLTPERSERQQDLLDMLFTMRAEGERPTLAGAAKRLGVGNSRVHQIAQALRARGDGDLLDDLLGRRLAPLSPETEQALAHNAHRAPGVGAPAALPTPAPDYAFTAQPPAEAATAPTALNPTAMPLTPESGASNPYDNDPASMGAAME